MDNGLVMIIVALIGAVGGVMVALIQVMRRENRNDHAEVAQTLVELTGIAIRTEGKVDTVKEELHDHLDWHKGEARGKVRKRPTGSEGSAVQEV